MAPSFFPLESLTEESDIQMTRGILDISFRSLDRYPHSFLAILDNPFATCWFQLSDETVNYKKLKRIVRINGDSIETNSSNSISSFGSGGISRTSSTSSVNSWPRLHFRDHIQTYTQRFLATEIVEETAASIIGSEDGGNVEEEDSGDRMKLVQLLISCAETVACRDKSHALALLSELRAKALVFGSSFQHVASYFVQELKQDHIPVTRSDHTQFL